MASLTEIQEAQTQNMVSLTEIQENQINISDHSTITDNSGGSRITDQNLTIEQKKRKFDEVYSSRRWQEEDKYEVQKVKQIVRNNIFKHRKFVKGEGVKIVNRKIERHNDKSIIKEYGKCHEKADLTKLSGYEYNLMKLAGVTEKNSSITERALYWKTYNAYVRDEIRQMRGRVSASIKNSINQGK